MPQAGDGHGCGPFERLVRILKDNERLLTELESTHARLRTARDYLSTPDCHLALALANLARQKSKRSGLLAVLRANRIAAEAIVGPLEPAAASAMA